VHEEDVEPANSIPREEENELMMGVKDIEVTAAGSNDRLLPVFCLDGVQKRVSLGMNMISEEEPSVGVMPHPVIVCSPTSRAAANEMKIAKSMGPSRNSENFKRKRLTPYPRPRKHLGDGNVAGIEEVDVMTNSAIAGVKSEDHVMVDEGLGAPTLTSSPAYLNPLMGP
jgi:hypothetical protein